MWSLRRDGQTEGGEGEFVGEGRAMQPAGSAVFHPPNKYFPRSCVHLRAVNSKVSSIYVHLLAVW